MKNKITLSIADTYDEVVNIFNEYAPNTLELFTFLKGDKLKKEIIEHILKEYDFHIEKMKTNLETENYSDSVIGFYLTSLLIMNQWMPKRNFHEILHERKKSYKSVMDDYEKNHKSLLGVD